MTHPNEPSLAKLKETEKELYAAESTDLNMQKLRAVSAQIRRRESA